MTLNEIKNRKVNHTEFYTKHFSKYFAYYFTKFFLDFKISANMVTYLMWLLGFAAAILIATPDQNLRLLACFFLIMLNILDTSDGEVARISQKTSRFGTVLDKLVHSTTNTALFFAIGYYFFKTTGLELFLLWSLFVVLILTADDLIKEMYVSQSAAEGLNTKSIKLELSLKKKSFLNSFLSATSSSVGFYHLYIIFLGLDLILKDYLESQALFQHLYLIYFLVMNLVKLLVRYKTVKSKLV